MRRNLVEVFGSHIVFAFVYFTLFMKLIIAAHSH